MLVLGFVRESVCMNAFSLDEREREREKERELFKLRSPNQFFGHVLDF